MEEPNYFFDTYALFEIVQGNPRFESFMDIPLTTSFMNLIEFYWALCRDSGDKRARLEYLRLRGACIDILDEDVFEAMRFRLEHRKKRFSYADSIGYILARRKGLRFLTGDRAFQGMENVEFVR